MLNTWVYKINVLKRTEKFYILIWKLKPVHADYRERDWEFSAKWRGWASLRYLHRLFLLLCRYSFLPSSRHFYNPVHGNWTDSGIACFRRSDSTESTGDKLTRNEGGSFRFPRAHNSERLQQANSSKFTKVDKKNLTRAFFLFNVFFSFRFHHLPL